MRKTIVCVCTYLMLLVGLSSKMASADEVSVSPSVISQESRLENHISGLYKTIDFQNGEVLPYDVFNKAYRGYLNLCDAGKLNSQKDIITICDLAMPSTKNRMWIIDLANKKVLFNTYVAHGQGSGDDGALSFSNESSTHKSSLGFYVTTDTYQGAHGTSLRLDGMDQGFNDAALERGIVVHGAAYVNKNYISCKDRLGRSWGCPAVPTNLSLPIIQAIKNGTCLFMYYPEAKYLKNAYWLNKKVAFAPQPICDINVPNIEANQTTTR
jgi:hypothetical protein